MAFGDPGKFRMKVVPRTPAVARERIAVGTLGNVVMRMASPYPGMSFSHTAAVASGVQSVTDGPVPGRASMAVVSGVDIGSTDRHEQPGCRVP